MTDPRPNGEHDEPVGSDTADDEKSTVGPASGQVDPDAPGSSLFRPGDDVEPNEPA